MLTRLLVWTTAAADSIDPVSTPDLIALGLVFHVSIINELEHLPAALKDWKSIQSGTALLFIALYGALYTLAIIGDNAPGVVDARTVLFMSMSLAFASALIGVTVAIRLSK